MRMPLLAAMAVLMLVTACATVRDSKFNPFNWFQRSTATTLEPQDGYVVVTDNRALVDQVLSLSVEPVPGGAIVRATGLPVTQGWWDGELVAENDGEPVEGVLTYRFLVAAPRSPNPVSTQQSREIIVATFLSNIKLAEISQINVQGLRTVRSTRR